MVDTQGVEPRLVGLQPSVLPVTPSIRKICPYYVAVITARPGAPGLSIGTEEGSRTLNPRGGCF